MKPTEVGTISERIAQMVQHFHKGNKSAFAKAVGISNQSLGEMVGERQGAPSFAALQKILAAFPQLRTEWVLFGRGEMREAKMPVAEKQGLVQFEWRFWFPAGLVGAWFKTTLEPDAPRPHGLYAGLVGNDEHDPLLQVLDSYQRAGQRSYVVEATVYGGYQPGQLREQLNANEWSPMPEGVRRLTPAELW